MNLNDLFAGNTGSHSKKLKMLVQPNIILNMAVFGISVLAYGT